MWVDRDARSPEAQSEHLSVRLCSGTRARGQIAPCALQITPRALQHHTRVLCRSRLEACQVTLTRRFLFDLQAGEPFLRTDMVDDDPANDETRRYVEAVAFTKDGTATLEVCPGTYRIVSSRGPEYDLAATVVVGSNESRSVTHLLTRVVEGYSATSGPSFGRSLLATEAIRLGRLVVSLLPEEPEPKGLLALMLLHDARRASRLDPEGALVPLEEQDRAIWDHAQITEGSAVLEAALRAHAPGPYQIQAAVAALHASAATAADTDWKQISLLYRSLLRLRPSDIVLLNAAAALAMATTPQRGLALLRKIEGRGSLASYPLFHAAKGDLLRRAGELERASAALHAALAVTTNAGERSYLERRLRELDLEPARGRAPRGERFRGSARSFPSESRRAGRVGPPASANGETRGSVSRCRSPASRTCDHRAVGLSRPQLVSALGALSTLEPAFARAIAEVGMPAPRIMVPGYATLLRTILGQQVSVASAASVYAKLEAQLGDVSDPARLIAASDDTLRACGLSRQKAGYARSLAALVTRGEVDLSRLPEDDEEAIAQLTKIKGIGRWSAEIYLLFAEARRDVWPAGDLAIQIEVGRLLTLDARPDEKTTRALAERWRPHRGAAAVFAWHHYQSRGRAGAPL